MLQPDSMLPDLQGYPAPWNLRGSAWIVALKLPAGAPARDAFLPPGLAGQGRGLASYLMFVDYQQSDCGPYRELLFIPGAFPFGDGRRHLTISRILVSTWDSVVNGRNNWGIPKDHADFDVQRGLDGGREDRVRVVSDGRELCELRLATRRFTPSLPVPGGLLPASLLTLAQSFRGRTYYYAPSAGGRMSLGRLLSWRFDAELFPDLAAATVLAAFKVESFRMTFPVAVVTG